MLNFPSPGDRVCLELFEAPVKNGESEVEFRELLEEHESGRGAVRLSVKLIGRKAHIASSYRLQKIRSSESKRLHDLRAADPEKVDPEIHDEGHVTETYLAELDAWARDVLGETLVGLEGFTIGGRPVEELGELAAMLGALEAAGWIELAAGRALSVQAPGAAERFLSGS